MRSPGYIPGPLVIPGVIEIVLQWAMANGKNATNVLHAQNTSVTAIDVARANTVFDHIAASSDWTAYALCLNGSTSLNFVKLRNLDVANQAQFESTSSAILGTGTGGTVPESVALVATLKTGFAGRSGRGRTYLTGFEDGHIDINGHATSGLTAAAQSFMLEVQGALGVAGMSLVVANRAHDSYVSPITGATIPAASAGSHFVESIVVQDNVFDSQRRRK